MDRKDFIEKVEKIKSEAQELYSKNRSENEIETRLCEGVKKMKGLCWKFTSPGTTGVPDRIVMIPTGQLFFVELKAPGCYPSPLQYRVHEMIRNQKQQVAVLSSFFEVDQFLSRLQSFIDYVNRKL